MENKELLKTLPKFSKDDFKLVHSDLSSKILDEKLKTKPTTFAKDAFKRFCKNKSSVVGAIIIGILLLGSFLAPIVSPYNIKDTNSYQTLLDPKIFKAGTGFWDGCSDFDDCYFDRVTKLPFGGPDLRGFTENAIISKKYKEYTLETNYDGGWDGYVYVVSNQLSSTDIAENKFISFYNSDFPLIISEADEVTATVKFGNPSISKSALCAKYRFRLQYYDEGTKKNQYSTILDWQDYQETVNIDISSYLASSSLHNASKFALRIEGLPTIPEGNKKLSSHMLINEVKFASNNSTLNSVFDSSVNFYNRTIDETITARENNVTLLDANRVSFNKTCWKSTNSFSGYGTKVYRGSIVYDMYEHKLGDRSGVTIGQSEMQSYIDKGWCKFEGTTGNLDDYDGTFSLVDHPFVVLNTEKCPVKEIESFSYDKMNGNVYKFQFITLTTYYKYKGFDKMPNYIFGTDNAGRDLLTLSLSCLKTSLLVAVVASAACLIIGLIWGSISGYFGGTVDLIMERITDILAGIPWIVMMTLIILHLGNSVVTFAIALIITDWIGTAGTTRTQFYRFRDREYVLASRTLGASDARLIFKHILPNGLGTIVTSSVLMIPGCIFSEASISYLGLGLKGVDSFGVLLSSSQKYLSSHPVLVLVPSIIISLLMISFNLFGNGLRDALNPTLKGGEQ